MVVRCIVVCSAVLGGCAADRQLAELADTGSDGSGASESGERPATEAGLDGSPPIDEGNVEESESGTEPGPRPGRDTPYPYCEWNDGAFEPFCPRTEGGHGFLNWHVEGDSSSYCNNDDCNACLCFVTCDDPDSNASDPSFCPVPTSGTAQPDCANEQDQCLLTCDAGETCPDGMTCVDMLEYQRSVCAWVAE